jgi:hypothetical protein
MITLASSLERFPETGDARDDLFPPRPEYTGNNDNATYLVKDQEGEANFGEPSPVPARL